MVDTCGFCGKNHTKVKRLIVGEPGNAICSECVDLCVSILNKERNEFNFEAVLEIEDINPMELKEYLDRFVVSQDSAKIVLSVAVANHYKRINIGNDKIDKANVLLLGPSGSGKTLLARTIAKYIKVPFASADATLLTEAGYVGDDVDTLLIKLLQSAEGEVHKAENGIIFIDEVDKIAKHQSDNSGADVSGEGVQQALLKLVEGTVYTVVFNNEEVEIDTTNILFIASGAFVNLNDIKKSHLAGTNMGFGAKLSSSVNVDTDYKDLIKYGFIPEFIGRFPIIAEIQELTETDMLSILNSVENNLVQQYKELFKYDKINITFHKEALKQVVKVALLKKTGARGLKSIMEKSLLPHMFNATKYNKNKIHKVVISKDLINNPREIKKK